MKIQRLLFVRLLDVSAKAFLYVLSLLFAFGLAVISDCCGATAANYGITGTTSFSDVPSTEPFASYIEAIYNNGITTGCGNGDYCPSEYVTRDQMAAFLVRATQVIAGQSPVTFTCSGGVNCGTETPYFSDVPTTDQFFPYVQKLKELGITTGCGNGNYCPSEDVTRDQMAAFLIRALYGQTYTCNGGMAGASVNCATTPPYFSDVPTTDQFFPYVQKLKELGITTGCGNGNYCPSQDVTRDQMAAFLARAFLGMVPLTTAGNVAKGPITGSTVKFFALTNDGSNGALLGSTTTDSSGNYTVTMTPAPTAPILAEASGGSYVNEVSGATDNLLSTDILTAVLPVGTTKSAITPLTHMAATRARALAASGISLATAVDAANVGVAQQYNLSDILGILPVAAGDATQIRTANRGQRNYGLVLAGITQEAENLNVRPIDLAAALATDMEDGILNGLGQNPIPVPTITGAVITLPPAAGTGSLQAAINTFLASGNNLTNLSGMSISTTPVNINPAGGNFYIAATALPALTEGQAGSFTIPIKGGTPPYTCAATQGSQLPSGMTLSQPGGIGGNWVLAWTPSLLAGGSTMSITSPFSVTCKDKNNLTQAIQWTATTVKAPPTTIPIAGACVACAPFSTPVATATGGVQPYYYKSPSFAYGAPPLGTAVRLDGTLGGTCPTAEGTYYFPVCAVDLIGADPCTTTSLTVTPPSCTYAYSAWSACQSDNTQSRTVVSSSPECCVGTPVLSQSCSSVGGIYYWANYHCNSDPLCYSPMGIATGSVGPLCTLSDCNAWVNKFYSPTNYTNPAAFQCSTTQLLPGIEDPRNSVGSLCASSGVDF